MSDPLDDLIDAAARALDLPIEPEWKAAVKTNLASHLAPRRAGRRVQASRRSRAGAGLRRLTPEPRMDLTWTSANAIAYAVHDGQTSARDVVAGALARIAAHNGTLNAFTAVTEQRALARADAIDAGAQERRTARAARRRAVRGQEPVRHRGPADASPDRRSTATATPAAHDSPLIERLEARRRRARRRSQHGRVRL